MFRLLTQNKKRYEKILLISVLGIVISIALFGSLLISSKGTWAFEVSSNQGGGWSSCAISQDGKYLVMGRFNYVYLFKKSNSKPLWSCRLNEDVLDVDISADGQHIIAGGSQSLYIFKKTNPTPLWETPIGNFVYDTVISSNGNYAAVCSSLGTTLYSIQGDDLMILWNTPLGDRGVRLSSDGNYIVCLGNGGVVYLFNKTSSTPIWQYTIGDQLFDIEITPNCEYIVIGGYVVGISGYELYLFNKSSPIPKIMYTEGIISGVAISQNGDLIATGGSDGIYLFNASSLTRLWKYSIPYESFVNEIAMSSDGEYIISDLYRYHADGLINRLLFFHKSSKSTRWIIDFNTRSSMEDIEISSNGNDIVVAYRYIFLHINRKNPIISGINSLIMMISLISFVTSLELVVFKGIAPFVKYRIEKFNLNRKSKIDKGF
ncbi:MAG: WD40 repeat domain-containing protein [Promethearchaeota archaeon]